LSDTDIDGGIGDIEDSTTANNGTTFNMEGDEQVAGKIGGSFYWDPDGEYVDISSVGTLTTFTFSLWVNPVDPDSWGTLVGWDNDNDIQIRGAAAGGNAWNVNYYDGGDNYGDTLVTQNAWNYVTITKTGDNVTFYLDGDSDGTATVTKDMVFDWIGANKLGADEGFGGQMDEIRISNAVRSADWIEASYLSQNGAFAFTSFGGEQVGITDKAAPVITARETVDSDANGQIDQIQITTSEALDDDFAGLTMTVDGYGVTGYSSDTANDNIFYVDLTESGTADTDATPTVTVTTNTTLSEFGGANNIATDGGTAATDKAAPVVLSAASITGSTSLALTFSESVYTTTGGAGDLVTGDFSYGNVQAGGATTVSSMSEADGSDNVVILTMDAAFIAADFGNDTIAAASAQIYDLADTAADTSAVTITSTGMSIMVSTDTDVTAGGAPGDDTWSNAEAFLIDNPNLDLGDTTNGTFAAAFDLDNFVDDSNSKLSAIHFVTQDITIGSGTSIDLQAGDIIISTAGDEAIGGVTFNDEDIFVFRPNTPDPYNSGTFFLLVDGSDVFGTSEVDALTLIEQDTTIGGTIYNAGTFLMSLSDELDIQHLDFTSVGSVTAGTMAQFLDSSDIDVDDQAVDGLELIETTTVIGGETLFAGELLISLQIDDASVGGNSITTQQHDVVKLNITAVGANAAATAAIFLDGSDVGLDTDAEDIKSLTLFSDVMGPVVLSKETADLNGDGFIDAIHVTFSEAIQDSTVSAGDWDVAGVTVDAFVSTTNGDTADDADIYITFADGVLDTGATPDMTYTQGTLADGSGNLLASDDTAA